MNTKPGPASGVTASTENTAGNMIKPDIMATVVSMAATLPAVFTSRASSVK